MTGLERRLRRAWYPPKIPNWKKSPVVTFRLDEAGKSTNVRLEKSSDNRALDFSAMEAVRHCQPKKQPGMNLPENYVYRYIFDYFVDGRFGPARGFKLNSLTASRDPKGASRPNRHHSTDSMTPDERDVSKLLKQHIDTLAGDIGVRSLTSSPAGLEKASSCIAQTFKAMNYPCSIQEYTVDSDTLRKRQQVSKSEGPAFDVVGKKSQNIVATLTGGDRSDEIIIVGAHYDSAYDSPAANDNATGIACMLELARKFSRTKFPRTIRFVAFTNEEPPFFRSPDMGSWRYAALCKERNEKIVAMLSLETLGYYTENEGSQQYPEQIPGAHPDVGNFVAFVGNTDSSALVTSCVRDFKNTSDFPCEAVSAPDSVPGLDFSDQQAFWRYKYPALMVTDTALLRYPHYHTRQDTPDKISCDKLSQVLSGLAGVVSNLGKDN